MTIALISHPHCVLHDAGPNHVERPERVSVIQEALKRYPFSAPVKHYQAPQATRDMLLAAHDETYVDWIISIAPKHGCIGLDEDTVMSPYTLSAALHAAGAAPLGVDLVMTGKESVAFCNVRPPGHHAERDKAMGFCFFNNVAIGALHAIKQHQLERIVIVDFDVHHGNGTQTIFQHDKRVMYCSSFEHPFYPGYDEEMDNAHISGVPLAAGTSGKEYREKVEKAWFAKIAAFKPQLLFFSAGFDAHANDPLADLNLVEDDYVWLTRQIAKIAKVHCDGRIVSVLEGGYNEDVLAQCAPAHVEALLVK